MRRKALNMLAAAYRVHGPDTVATLAELFEERGSTVNLLGTLRCTPPRAERIAQSPLHEQATLTSAASSSELSRAFHAGPPCPVDLALPNLVYCHAHRPPFDPMSIVRSDRREGGHARVPTGAPR
jgi:hypothetical protein